MSGSKDQVGKAKKLLTHIREDAILSLCHDAFGNILDDLSENEQMELFQAMN